MSVWSLLLCGGSGLRMGGDTPKTLLPLHGEAVFCHALRTLRRHSAGVVLVARAQDEPACRQALDKSGLTVEALVFGGEDRQASVQNGLAALPPECDIVVVHDGARPLTDDRTVEAAIASARQFGSGVASVPVTDTVRTVSPEGVALQTLDRGALRAAQTPQVFQRALLERAHRAAAARYTDDASLVAALGVPVRVTMGSARNLKLTTPEDLALANFYLGGAPRIGHGYDAHRLVENRPLVLGGVTVPFEKGLLGHSDADVLLHALMDALLGAAALGDIGQHFPDRDPAYSGISSLILLEKVASLLTGAGFAPVNVDATVIAQRPRLAPYLPAMRRNIAGVLNISLERVSVKATTTEGMGFTGSGEGVSAHAVALLGGA